MPAPTLAIKWTTVNNNVDNVILNLRSSSD